MTDCNLSAYAKNTFFSTLHFSFQNSKIECIHIKIMTYLTSSCPDVKFNSVVDVSSWIERFLGKLLSSTLNTLINSNVESHHVHSASDCMHVLAKIQSSLVVARRHLTILTGTVALSATHSAESSKVTQILVVNWRYLTRKQVNTD